MQSALNGGIDVVVPLGESWTNTASLSIPSGRTLTVRGAVMYNYGTINNYGTIDNEGTFSTDYGYTVNNGVVCNSGTIHGFSRVTINPVDSPPC